MPARTSTALAVFVALSSVALASDPAAPLVHVAGHGLVRVAPDQVVIRLTVTTTDDDLIRVRENSDKDARTILSLAKKHGADDTGFEVSRLELSLDYNEQLRRQIYQIERDVTIRLDDLTKLDAILSDLLRERNLKVVGVNFVTSNVRQHEFKALSRAVADAKEKATLLAELNGFTLGNAREIRVISERKRPFAPFATSIIPVVGSAEPRGTRSVKRDSAQVARDARNTNVLFVAFQPADDQAKADDQSKADGKPFALGMNEITAQVNINFELAE